MSTNDTINKKYACAIKSLEDRIKAWKKSVKYKDGHLINSKYFEELKTKVDYKNNKNIFLPKNVINNNEKKFKCKDLEIKTSKYLINMLLNGNKYIIVDSIFYQIICDKDNKNANSFQFISPNNSNDLNIFFSTNDVVNLTKLEINKINTIDSSKLKNKSNNNYEEIKKVYESINKYYNFEIALEKDMLSKTKGNNSSKGYLIEKESLDKWKEKIQYDEIKNKYLTKGNLDKEAKDKLIYLFEKKNLTYFNLIEIINTDLNTKQNVDDFIKTKSLALVSEDFISSLEVSNKLKKIEYYIYDNTIEIIFDSNNTLSIKCKDNIIESNSNLGENNNNQNSGNNNDNNFANYILTILLNMF